MPPEHKYALPPGFCLRQYRIARLLGHGGFGLTYLADDTNLQRKVAIKEMLPIDFAIREPDGTTVVARSERDRTNLEWARRSFVEEGRTLAALQHPSILHVYDIFELHGTAYLVTAFIEGANLEQWLRRGGALHQKAIAALLSSLLDALQLVHERGFLHRDIKPENILMDDKGSHPVLIDFGNARMSTGEKTCTMTAVLTRGYAPVEQYQTKGRQGPFTDVYALGAVLYRAITGAPPADALDRLDEDKIQVLSGQRIPGFSGKFLATIDKALKMNRADRWQRCEEWTAALGAADPPLRQSPGHAIEPPELKPAPHAGAGGQPAMAAKAMASDDVIVCVECGRGFPKSRTVEIEGFNVCADCQPTLIQKLRKEMAAGAGTRSAAMSALALEKLRKETEAGSPAGIWRSGRQLVTSLNATLPARCIKCNAPAEGKPIKRKLSYLNPAVYLALLVPVFGVIVYLITALITRKTGVAMVSICRRHRFARRLVIIVSWLLVLIGLAAVVMGVVDDLPGMENRLVSVAFWGGLVFGIVSPRKPVVIVSSLLVLIGLAVESLQNVSEELWIVWLGEIAFLGGIFLGTAARRLVVARKIDQGQMWLGGCGREFLAGFPEWNEPK